MFLFSKIIHVLLQLFFYGAVKCLWGKELTWLNLHAERAWLWSYYYLYFIGLQLIIMGSSCLLLNSQAPWNKRICLFLRHWRVAYCRFSLCNFIVKMPHIHVGIHAPYTSGVYCVSLRVGGYRRVSLGIFCRYTALSVCLSVCAVGCHQLPVLLDYVSWGFVLEFTILIQDLLLAILKSKQPVLKTM